MTYRVRRSVLRSGCGSGDYHDRDKVKYSPPRRGGVDAPTASGLAAQTGWSDRRNVSDELTTPARQPCGCRASPPLRGGECIRSKLVHSIYLCGGGTTDWSCLCVCTGSLVSSCL